MQSRVTKTSTSQGFETPTEQRLTEKQAELKPKDEGDKSKKLKTVTFRYQVKKFKGLRVCGKG